ncbi:hypothetical protein ANCDUO_05832 [Ancylostoma duodenale]|uniref:BHLH domain-containing protein n=1 Tax=Ancylostoma duodenale TaxID=51022 RepID=A0A0C2GXV1_9BILA|nr:hypothetical protein ANCDUO_05832 [Ancylostoma duodenale]
MEFLISKFMVGPTLRTVLPEMDSGRRLSKYETLQMAQQYIACLMEILGEDGAKQTPEK